MSLYTVGRSNFAISTATDSLAIVSSAYALRISMANFTGVAVASSANEIIMFRATTVGSTATSGSITPSRLSTAAAAAGFGVFSGFGSSTASTAGDVMWRFAPNGNGGYAPFTALPGAEISMGSSSYVLFRASLGSGSMTCNLLIEELAG